MRAIEQGLIQCHTCQILVKSTGQSDEYCPLCGSKIYPRKPNSLAKSWAFLITAMLTYIPANTLPIINSTYLGLTEKNTIMDGVIYFIREKEWFLAAIIFTASILVPLLKMISLLYLLLSVHWNHQKNAAKKGQLYGLINWIGRWSMIDVFVITLMTALVQMGPLSQIKPGWGALAFAAVVVFSMLAVNSFDPRLIWDE